MMSVLWAFLGSLGFAIIFNMKGKQIWMASVGGAATWFLYTMLYDVVPKEFVCAAAAAAFVALYAELMAKFAKAPTTVFLTSAAIPLIPGGGLYYTMRAVVYGNGEEIYSYGYDTLETALGIAVGFVVVAVVFKSIRRREQIKKKTTEGNEIDNGNE